MASELELAVLAYSAYPLSRKNELPTGDWTIDTGLTTLGNTVSGFAATVYTNGNGEAVISFRGTDDDSFLEDWYHGNIPAANGVHSMQVAAAMELLADVRAHYPSAQITLTGHSLGGGLASLLGTYFDLPAVVFDPAPFGNSALGTSSVNLRVQYYNEFNSYLNEVYPAGSISPAASAALSALRQSMNDFVSFNVPDEARTSNVSGFYLDGEALEYWRTVYPTAVGNLAQIDTGAITLTDGKKLHSMSLLLAMKASPALQAASAQLPTLLADMMDGKLYFRSDQDADNENFLNRLLKQQLSDGVTPGTGLVDRFAADVLTLVGASGLVQTQENVRDALIVAAMEYYYFKDPASATALFTVSNGGIHFKYSDIGASQYKSLPRLRAAVTGLLGSAEQSLAGALVDKNAWHIQEGSNPLVWTANVSDPQNDAAIGGSGVDTLNAGAGNDVLVGLGGDDQLTGGQGSDTLMGGAGNDTYYFNAGDGSDVVLDAGGSGTLKFGASQQEISGGLKAGDNYWVTDPTASGEHFTFSLSGGNTLVIGRAGSTDTIVVRNWSNTQLGITLSDTPVSLPPPTTTLTGDYGKLLSSNGVTYLFDSLGNYQVDAQQALGPQMDDITGTANVDQISGGALNDALSGRAGDDQIDGGTGDDVLMGGLGRDVLNGGAGRDYIYGSGDGTQSKPPRIDTPPPVADGTEWSRGLGWVTFDAGTDPHGAIYGLVGVDSSTLANDAGNVIDGGAGNDLIRAGSGADVVHGGDDNDDIQGLAGGDTLFGDAGNDSILGDGVIGAQYTEYTPPSQQGNDVIDGGTGDDMLAGQGGDDVLFGGTGNDQLYGDQSMSGDPVKDDTPVSVHGNDYLDGGDDADYLEGGGRDDILIGGLGNDTLYGDGDPATLAGTEHGKDTLDGGDGNDQLVGGGNDDVLFGGADDDTLFGDDSRSTLEGQYQGADLLDGGDGKDTLVGGGKADTLFGGTGNDTLFGDASSPGLSGADSGEDFLDGEDGNDILIGGAKADTLFGGIGNDTLEGDDATSVVAGADQGDDYLDGEDGNDTLLGNGGADTLIGGAGTDQLYGDASDTPAEVQGNDYLDGGDDDDILVGGGGADTLIGGTGADQLYGEAADTPDAVQGNDSLDGGSGADVLVGGGGADILSGGSENDQLFGDSDATSFAIQGDDYLDGGSGADYLRGYGGNDTYVVDDVGDAVSESANGGIDTVLSSVTYALANDVENITLTGTDNLDAAGNSLDNTLTGNLGDNRLTGGAGNDTYVVDNVGDVVVELASQGTDTVQSSLSYVLGSDLENLTLTGAAAINGTGNSLNNILIGNSAANVLTGGLGNDTYSIGAGDTVIENAGEGIDTVQSSVTYTLASTLENLTLTGTAAINGTGNASDNILLGNSAANTLTGGAGNDTYGIDNVGDVVVENASEGSDTVQSSVSFTLGANLENLTLTGTDAINGTGNSQDNILLGNSAANTLTGGAGNDTYGVDNIDDIVVENASQGTDLVQSSISYTLGSNLENLTLTGFAAIDGTGNTGDNVITGNNNVNTLTGGGGNDTLNGLGGADTMIGGTGNDTYVVDNTNDIVTESSGEGTDAVQASASYTLSANVENLTLTGAAAINATGNTLANVLTGNTAANTLDGSSGADQMIGGAGDDTYVIDNAGDTVTENASEGIDTVQSSLAYTLGANVENLTLSGSSAINGTGNTLDNVLTGNSGANTLTGGAGNDTYVVGTGDTVVEGASAGTDLVQSSVTWTLGTNVENLTLTGSSAINGTGNTLDNILTGNSGNNTLTGGAGNDTYVIGSGDTVVENASEGTDLVQSSVTYTLANNLENLTLTGSSAINGTGNTVDNILIGNTGSNALSAGAGNDTIDGGIGADSMSGGTGNDTFVVDNAGDTVTENASEGTDLVQSSITWTLGSNLENLQLTGASAISGTGNTLDNLITGNGANNTLSGGAGNDTINGGAGNDTMSGGTGNDIFVVDSTSDTATENASEGTDLVQSSVSFTIGTNVENLTLTGSANVNATGNSAANTLIGNAGNNTLDGGTGADTMQGGAGNDIYFLENAGDIVTENASEGTDLVQSSMTYTLGNNVENLTLTGTSNINGTGNALANVITGNSGINTLTGGAGDDTYTVNTIRTNFFWDSSPELWNFLDTVTEAASAGNDTIIADSVYGATLSANAEKLVIQGALSGYSVSWNTTQDVRRKFTGNALDNVIDATLAGSNGFGLGTIGTGGYDEGEIVIDGGAGADQMIGADLLTRFIVDNVNDVVVGGVRIDDRVQTTVSYTLPTSVEYIDLAGTSAITATGNSANNRLDGSGNTAANLLIGGTGNDTYVLGAGDTVQENASEGTDTVILMSGAVQTYTVTTYANTENMTLGSSSLGASNITGSAVDNVLVGNASANTLTGAAGNDTLDGGAGNDTMVGGLGNDTYTVDSTSDVVTENASEGTDLIQSSVTYTASANVENLTLTGATAINGTGNALDNVLTGNSAANTLSGGAGNDTYYVTTGDTVVENAGEGTDMVFSLFTWTLGSNVENLTLTGIGGTESATGNSLANVLTGQSGDNVLDGGAGADTMIGAAGNDTYVVDNAGDVVTENASEGTDLVQSSVTYTLANNVENLTLTGASAINGTGNALDNVLTGNSAVNTLTGGAGNDIYVVTADDIVVEGASAGIDSVQSDVTFTLASNIENLTLTGASAVNGTGNALDNVLTGNSAANTLTGGAGNDTYVVGTGDSVVENANEGTDLVQSSTTFTLSANVENLTLTGTGAINGTGNSLANSIIGNSGDNVLDGGAGADSLTGGAGNDTYVVDDAGDTVIEGAGAGTDLVQSAVTFALTADLENLTLTGTAAVNGTGNAGANILTGNSGDNVLDGGAGADTLTGGAGNDTYVVDNAGDTVMESAASGTDLVQSSLTYTLGSNVENLTLTGNLVIDGTGNTLDNTLVGNSNANTLDGGVGADVMSGGAGNDTYKVDNAGDQVIENISSGMDTVMSSLSYALGANVENLTLTGTASINATGNSLGNVLTGNSGDNILDGGYGRDTMSGGAGNDTYVVDDSTEFVTESAGAGTDLVQSSVTYTLGSNLENLTLIGALAINGTGNSLNNVIVGNASANTLDGSTGADAMSGGAGDDIYYVDNAGDSVTENADEGTDTVISSVTQTLGANVERLTLAEGYSIDGTGNALDNVLTGNSFGNTLTGGAGNDTLDGSYGADTLVGGLGNDTYVVDDAGDTVVENGGEGADLVQSAVTYTLGSNLEDLTLTGYSYINGTGNALDNVLTGNAADNTLDGGVGADTMAGGAGNDTYIVDAAADVVSENANEGYDLVQSAVTYALADNVENLSLTGSSSIDATGNALDNTLVGNSGNNVLDGGAGNDTMTGGTGDDTYVVDSSGDTVSENAGEGIDTVNSSVTFTLGSDVEMLFLSGYSAIDGTGNTLSNLLRGNDYDNILVGGGGADILESGYGNDTLSNSSGNSLLNGGQGNDTLTGGTGDDVLIGGGGADTITTGAGADIIAFNLGDGQDTVAVSTTQDNVLALGGGATYADLVFQKSGNDLILDVGASDQITFTDYYADTANRSVDLLQMVIEGTSDYDSNSSDPTRNNKIETFDFDGLVAAFDTARAADPNLTTWSLTNALTAQHLSGSDTAAIGGDLSYRYNRFGNLSDISFTPALGILGTSGFGSTAQALQALGSLQDTTPRLS